MLNMLIALMVEKKFIEEQDGAALVEKLKFSTLPGDFPSALLLMRKILAQIEKER